MYQFNLFIPYWNERNENKPTVFALAEYHLPCHYYVIDMVFFFCCHINKNDHIKFNDIEKPGKYVCVFPSALHFVDSIAKFYESGI